MKRNKNHITALAKNMSEKRYQKVKEIYTRLTRRYRISVHQTDSNKEVWNTTTSQIQSIVILVVAVAAIGFVIFSLFAWTPLHNMLPGYLKSETRTQIVDNALRVDSLSNQIRLREQYINNIARILTDDIPLDSIVINDSIAASLDSAQSWTPDILTKSSPESEAFARAYEKEEQFNLTMLPAPTEGVLFHIPIKGKIVKTFNPQQGKYGIELKAARQEAFTAVLDGTIVSVAHTISQGYVVAIQHNNNYVSIYRNIADCLGKTGDKVVAGERIGTLGNDSNDTAYFELWHTGIAVDPLKYIAF